MSFRSRRWLRTAALFYDQISRIVPRHIDPDTPITFELGRFEAMDILNDVKELSNAGILNLVRPEDHTAEVAEKFFDFSWEYLSEPERLNRLVPTLARRSDFYTIDTNKMDGALARVLEERDLVRRIGGDLAINPVIGGLYMLFLARHLAGGKALVSDNSVYQNLLCTSFGKDEDGAVQKPTGTLANPALKLVAGVIETVVPEGMERAPINSLLKLRDKYAEHRVRFQEKISELARSLDKEPDQSTVSTKLRQHVQAITEEVDNIQDKLLSQNIGITSALLSFSIPVTLALEGHYSSALATGAIAVGSGVGRYILDRRVAERSPWMYLVHVNHAIRPRTLAERITTLNLETDGEDEDEDSRVVLL